MSLDKHFNVHISSKAEAIEYHERLKAEVRAGTFSPGGHAKQPETVTQPVTVSDAFGVYCDDLARDPSRRRHRVDAHRQMAGHIRRTPISIGNGKTVAFGDLPVADVRTPHIEAFRDSRRAILLQRESERQERLKRLARGESTSDLPPPSTEIPRNRAGEIGINRNLEFIRRLFNWAITKGLYERENPFHRFGRRVIKMARQQPRTRRLQPGEEERLLAAAGVHLRHLITAALDTGCRRGELLSVQWRHVTMNADGEPRAFVLAAHMTKTDRGRSVPISPRLRAILQMRRLDPEGKAHGPDAYVFGNQFGEEISDIKLAWRGACRRAGIEGLTFHDLRREAASRLLQGGVDLLTVSMLLGHQKATTTDTYLRGREDVVERELREYHERQQPLR